jgi:hypothetical protein
LLIDFEKRKTVMESVKEEIKELQERYSILSAQLNKSGSQSLKVATNPVGVLTKIQKQGK